MSTANSNSKPTYRRASSFVSLAALLLAASSSPVAAKKCIKISRGKQLKKKLETSHVLVALAPNDEATVYKELCQYLEKTANVRVGDFEIALVEDKNAQKNLLTKSAPPKVSFVSSLMDKVEGVFQKAKEEEPTLVIAPEEQYILFHKNTNQGVLYEPKSELTASSVADFVSDQLDRAKIGSFLYSYGMYDNIASQFMNTDQDFVQKLWVKGVFPMFTFMHKLQGSLKEYEKETLNLYVQIGNKVLEKGKDYPKTQMTRLENMLKDEDNKISELQKEKMAQKTHILKQFAEPKVFTADEQKEFYKSLGFFFMPYVMLILFLPVMMMDDEDDKKKEQEQVKKAEEGLEKEEEEAEAKDVALQEAEEKLLKEDATGEEETAVVDKETDAEEEEEDNAEEEGDDDADEIEYADMTVKELRDILKERDQPVYGRKAELIERCQNTE
ncbi:predicted protein [Chaetoceros tenuissimus]|uniref:SAP domain-containing protein n=1 Tax=Chaetoceros tenuissimus TaxID=426638 RepID=A0AAD3HAE3_9STRA|nr:predicted protein [Chaetoceros tenuissimus]